MHSFSKRNFPYSNLGNLIPCLSRLDHQRLSITWISEIHIIGVYLLLLASTLRVRVLTQYYVLTPRYFILQPRLLMIFCEQKIPLSEVFHPEKGVLFNLVLETGIEPV